MFGTDADMKTLCREAEKRGIAILCDGVFNHTGSDSVYFNREGHYPTVGAYQSERSPWAHWYRFRAFPDDYECWWGVKTLPRVDSADPSYRRFISGRVVDKWMDAGIAGWRLDVADELSDELLDRIKAAAEAEKPGSIIIGEVWEDASNKIAYGVRRRYFSSRQLDSVMNYPIKAAAIDYVKNGDAESFARVFGTIKSHYPDHVIPYLMNFLGTHDTERILTVLGADPAGDLPGSVLAVKRMSDKQYAEAKKKFYLSFSLLCFLPGTVSVYYGDEAGMQGYRDPFNRMPYPWGREDKAMIKKVSTLLKNRKKYRGGADIVFCDGSVLGVQRGEYLYLSNASDEPVTLTAGGYKCRSFDGDSRPLTLPPATYKVLKRK
jgi:glycosidase